MIDLTQNKSFCMAPWTHTFVSPQTERRLCCASRESSSYVKQYIDQPGSAGSQYRPITLEEHWNGEFLKGVRRKMLKGEEVPECTVCSQQTLQLETYRDYFTRHLFSHLIPQALSSTDENGQTTLRPISFDYRIKNDCNFKCRMCGEQLSSAWENEKRKYEMWSPHSDPWMVPEVKGQIEKFQREVIEKEFAQAISEGGVEEIYWVGGEPLIWEEHWRSMAQLVRDGHASKVFCRYNTNLCRVKWKGVHLFDDLLPHFKGYNVCASIDAPGKIGEFIRTGLNWDKWLLNFKSGLKYIPLRGENSLVLDVTITLPGLLAMKEMLDLALELDSKMMVKIIFAFDPQVVLSPFALPRHLLDDILDDLVAYAAPRVNEKTRILLSTFQEMKKRPTFQEQYPETWEEGFRGGRDYQRRLGKIRRDGQGGRLSLEDIYRLHPGIYDWWTREI